MFILAEVKKFRDGWGPKIKKGVGFLLVASHKSAPQFGVYEVSDNINPKHFTKLVSLDEELDSLLASAKRFPPILALSKNRIEKNDCDSLTRKEFCNVFKRCILDIIHETKINDFKFCKCLEDEIGYRYKGEYYWIIETDSEARKVRWVSSDFYIYSDNIDCFDL